MKDFKKLLIESAKNALIYDAVFTFITYYTMFISKSHIYKALSRSEKINIILEKAIFIFLAILIVDIIVALVIKKSKKDKSK